MWNALSVLTKKEHVPTLKSTFEFKRLIAAHQVQIWFTSRGTSRRDGKENFTILFNKKSEAPSHNDRGILDQPARCS